MCYFHDDILQMFNDKHPHLFTIKLTGEYIRNKIVVNCKL